MVRDYRPGPDWVPAVVVEVLGPVTYIVETDQGQHWKRHADQLKSWMRRPVTESNPDPNDVSSDVEFVPDESQGDTSPGLPDIGDSATDENSDENDPGTPERESSEADSNSEPQAEGRRYPVRVRQAPNYFK